MTAKDIERLSLEELERMAEDPQTGVPETLAHRLEDIACAAYIEGDGAARLAERPGVPGRWRLQARWLWGAVPAAALATLALILLLQRPRQPKDTFSDPTLAYIEMTRAFSMFREAMQDADKPNEILLNNNGL